MTLDLRDDNALADADVLNGPVAAGPYVTENVARPTRRQTFCSSKAALHRMFKRVAN